MPERYAVFGNPIAHSKSPIIHAMFAEQADKNIIYEKTLIEEGSFAKEVASFFDSGGKGLNITVPFKEEAFALSAQLSDRARTAKAVNTLSVDSKGVIKGDNTDGLGLIWDIKENNAQTLADATILILGAGGATRGVLLPLLEEKPRRIIIANRTLAKAQTLAAEFQGFGSIEASSLEDAASLGPYDLVINATSASVGGKVPAISASVFADQTFAYDMFYSHEPTSFLSFAIVNGVSRYADGMGMLVGQAAASFSIWTGYCPDIRSVVNELKRKNI